MSKQVTIKGSVQGYTTGATVTLADDVAADLVNRGLAVYVIRPQFYSAPLDADLTVTSDHDGDRYHATTAITLTIPAGLSPRPELTVFPPPTGNLTIAFSGGATGNGAATSITRTRAANPAGIVITPYPDVTDGYGVSGA